MSRRVEQSILLFLDFLTINAAYAWYYWLRIESGWFTYAIQPEFWTPMLVIYGYWLVWFAFFGLYRHWYAQSRLDEVMTLFRTTAVGTLVLFFLVFLDDQPSGSGSARELILVYWFMLFGLVSIGRLGIRALQKRLLELGVGARNTLIVGWSRKAFELCDMVLRYPALGYKVVGFAKPRTKAVKRRKSSAYRDLRILGNLESLPKLLEQHQVKEVLIGLDSTEHDQLLDIIRYCNGHEVGMKIIPDLYDIVSGQARINSIYGFPLIEVMPELMKPWEEIMKRAVDITVAGGILLIGLPIWALVAIAIKVDSPGPVFYPQERVGRNGRIFTMMKFRSMKQEAERHSGPKWAERNDPRVTRAGKIIRRLHLDEVPQFVNVLVGDMSLVGPRPERPYFVEKLQNELPLYRRRLKVRPGITGWAQIKYHYDQSIEDVKSKLKYDLFYIENMSWRMDLKILFNTLYVMIRSKGQT
ncbi:MAG: sugar transferase [Ignavibacteriales bacterium]|nr:sugar transferase [Ignavibacteriales bacterium]